MKINLTQYPLANVNNNAYNIKDIYKFNRNFEIVGIQKLIHEVLKNGFKHVLQPCNMSIESIVIKILMKIKIEIIIILY